MPSDLSFDYWRFTQTGTLFWSPLPLDEGPLHNSYYLTKTTEEWRTGQASAATAGNVPLKPKIPPGQPDQPAGSGGGSIFLLI